MPLVRLQLGTGTSTGLHRQQSRVGLLLMLHSSKEVTLSDLNALWVPKSQF